MSKATKVAEQLHEECCAKGCEREVDGSWLRFGEDVAAGKMSYARAVELLGTSFKQAR